jgi:hypothetical protein
MNHNSILGGKSVRQATKTEHDIVVIGKVTEINARKMTDLWGKGRGKGRRRLRETGRRREKNSINSHWSGVFVRKTIGGEWMLVFAGKLKRSIGI